MPVDHVLYQLTEFVAWKYYYHLMPLLIQFGNLKKQDLLRHNDTALAAAAAAAKANIVKCVVGSMQDPEGTQALLRCVPHDVVYLLDSW
jgi:hypothetical protein